LGTGLDLWRKGRAARVAHGRGRCHLLRLHLQSLRVLLKLLLLLLMLVLQLDLGLLPGSSFGCPQLFQMECLPLLQQCLNMRYQQMLQLGHFFFKWKETYLTLVFQSFPFTIHDGFKFFKMPQFDLQFLHLSFHQECNQRFDFAFLGRR